MIDYILIGCGGFALEVAEYIKNTDSQHAGLDQKAIVSDVVSHPHSRFDELCSILGYRPIFHETPQTVAAKPTKRALICLGSPEDRHRNFTQLKKLGFSFGKLVHQTAWIAGSAQICEGTIICPFAFVAAKAEIEANCVVNVRASIGHDVALGMSSVVSPHVDLNGASQCGRVSFIGAGAILDPKSSIGDYTKVASGAVVKGKFGDGFLLAGNPAKGRPMFKIGKTDSS
ncbi:MAG: hypothetical protein VX252_15460 [Myxococcota bacterium]|nr:hypothetical protein [Myxococcota bacterium]